MDYKQTPPPGWETRTPDEWERAAHEARAMGRTALHYMPDLVPMFTAWAAAWDERRAVFTAADKGARASAHAAVVASVEGRPDEARSLFASAARAAECAREVRGLVPYRSFLETIPNRE